MKKTSQSSLIDFLVNNKSINVSNLNAISIYSKQAKNLYSLFVASVNGESNIKIAKPMSMHTTDFVELQLAGLIKGDVNNATVTANGAKLLEKMILSDDDCTFALKTNVGSRQMGKLSQENFQVPKRGNSIFRS
jgi:hypothetical protein